VRQGAPQEHRPNPKKVPPVPQSDGFLHHAESKQRKKGPPAPPEDGSDEPLKVEGRKVQRSAAPPQKPASVPTLPLTAQVAAQTCKSFLPLLVLFCVYAERCATGQCQSAAVKRCQRGVFRLRPSPRSAGTRNHLWQVCTKEPAEISRPRSHLANLANLAPPCA